MAAALFRRPAAGALPGEVRVAAEQQALGRMVGMPDLHQVALVEERELEMPAAGQGGDLRGAQRRELLAHWTALSESCLDGVPLQRSQ